MPITRMRIHLLLLVFIFSVKYIHAQPGALDMSFDVGNGADSTITCAAVQSDGKILIGGNFTSINGQVRPFLARLNSNGSIDNTFNIGSGPNRQIFSIAIQPDDKILIGGDVTCFNGDSVYKFIRLLPDGSTDTTFKADTIQSRTKEIILQPDGKILIGGSFTGVNGKPYINLARLHSNGKLDTTFNTRNALNGTVETMALQPDGKLLIGGSFTQYFGVQGYRVARVNTDGTADTTFNPGIGGAGSTVEALSLLPNGKILLGGEFTFYNGSTVGHIVRTNSDGTIDFTYPQTPGTNLPVRALACLQNGSHFVGGEFTSYNGNLVSTIALVKQDGTLDGFFNPGTGANDEITSLKIGQNNKLLLCGYFTQFNGIQRNRIARLYNCLTPQPDSIYGIPYALCSGSPQTYHVNAVPGATTYEWTLPNGWTGSSDSTSITAIGNGNGGILSVRAFSDSCGWSYTTTRLIQTLQPPGVDICLVTVDSNSTHNIVLWEKPISSLIDSFYIYREISSNNYIKIGSLAYAEPGEFHDYGANPNATSYRYKLSVIDTCGAESALSPYHSTIHLQNLGNGNFQWTFYAIQGQANPVLSFNMYREPAIGAGFFPIGNIPGTNSTFTDLTFNAFTDSRYVVDVNWNIGCNPFRQVNTTRSNIRPRNTIDLPWPPLGIEENVLEHVRVYPNPATDKLYLTIPPSVQVIRKRVVNLLGETVFSTEGNTDVISVERWQAGLYVVQIETNLGILQRLFSVQ